MDGEHASNTDPRWLCPNHRPTPVAYVVEYKDCDACARPTRPHGTLRVEHPGTLSRRTSNPRVLCSGCYQMLRNNGTTEVLNLPEATPEQKSATLRLLEEYNALDLATMLGL